MEFNCSTSLAIWLVNSVLSRHTFTTPLASPLARIWGLQKRYRGKRKSPMEQKALIHIHQGSKQAAQLFKVIPYSGKFSAKKIRLGFIFANQPLSFCLVVFMSLFFVITFYHSLNASVKNILKGLAVRASMCTTTGVDRLQLWKWSWLEPLHDGRLLRGCKNR